MLQISIADDACQPPVALQGKLKETDKLIQAETSETGRVSQITCYSHDNYMYQEECIPVGCLPSVLVAVWGGGGFCLGGCLPRVASIHLAS